MDPIYMDHAATTPVRPEVREAMAPYFGEQFGNPSSVHRWGREARAALEEARERVAAVLGADRANIVFTGGGTEADNLAVLGRARWMRRTTGASPTIVCSAIEHKAVLDAANEARREGASLTVLGVDEEGRVDPGALDDVLDARPAVVSVIWGNNEVGTLQAIRELGSRCREAGVVFHSDAVQALGKVPVDTESAAVDLLTVTAHKIGGPKGVGALYVREGVELVPLVHGGGQERALRPGTQNVAAVVGFAKAAELARDEQEREHERLAALRDRLEAALRERVSGLRVNAGGAKRLPHVLNVSLPGVDQEAILMALDLEGIAVSSGSACQSGAVDPSHVLVAMGRASSDEASVRISLGRTTTEGHVDRVADTLPGVVERVRAVAGV